MARTKKAKPATVSVRAKRDATVGGDIVGRDKIQRRHIEQHYHYGAATPLDAKLSRKPAPYDILPHSFEIWLHQEIPHVEICFYAVNYLAAELVLQTFSVTSFHLSGGPNLESISAIGEVRVPPHQSVHVCCRRPLADSEARTIERTQQTNQSNAMLFVSTRGFAGRKELNRDLPSLSANGWVRGGPSRTTLASAGGDLSRPLGGGLPRTTAVSTQREPMPKIWTLGGTNRRTQFAYSGSVSTGVTIQFSGKPYISSEFFKAILKQFAGRTIAGGFSMTEPTPGGLGQWVKDNSNRLNGTSLTPRHASFIAAILVHEGLITSSLKGNAVYLHFGTTSDKQA